MSNRNRKYQEIEFGYAALMATLNLIVFALTATALGGLFLLFNRIGDYLDALASKMPLLVMLLIFGGGLTTAAQTISEEQILRELIRREAAGSAPVNYHENAVFASDSLPRPVVLENVRDVEAVKIKTVAARRRQILKIEVRRIVVAESKDIAYEYSDFTLTYDQPDKTRDGYVGSLLRVWRKAGGEGLVDAAFARQNTRDENR